MALKPWYKVVTPREDLREGRPMDASEFAVHLDDIRNGRAPLDYQDPVRFFERTYLTKSLETLSGEVIRRLSGIRTETNAVFNLSTQFGGGKTHSLALLYHLLRNGDKAVSWNGVTRILGSAGVTRIPQAATAVFVGLGFDSIKGRGGKNGEPLRKTPWGEIAWQLGGIEAFKIVEEHDIKMTAPGNDVLKDILPHDRPCLILMDELMNYMSRSRKMGMADQFYNFLQNLSEEVCGRDNAVLVVSIPASELEMTAEDHSDHERLKKLLDRLGKAMIMSAEGETSEIIRRRLFEWNGVSDEAKKTISEYANWIIEHHNQVGDFPVDHAREAFTASYPFHPTVLSVFERKWQALPRFQRTRGILRLLALWVSNAYQEGFKGAHRDALITLGTAPLDDPMFRAAIFEQLGEIKLEIAVTTDIAGKPDAHSIRLDKEAADTIKKARLHRKVATTIFFESNGGQTKTEATLPEIRLAVAEPGSDIGNIETVLETLGESCYFLRVERNRYRFGITVTLPKILADRKASILQPKIDERIREEIHNVFKSGNGFEKVFFPQKSNSIPDRAALTLLILPPEQSRLEGKKTNEMIESFTREYGESARTFKSALIWSVPESSSGLDEVARKLLAWEGIKDEKEELKLDDSQIRQLDINIGKSEKDLKEAVWRAYNNIILLGIDNKMRHIPLGMIHSSAATSIIALIINRLKQDDCISDSITPNVLLKNWPPAFIEWSTKSVRDAFYSSPQFYRILDANILKDTIARGVENKKIAYVGKSGEKGYDPFNFGNSLDANDIEFSDDMFIIKEDKAIEEIKPSILTSLNILQQYLKMKTGEQQKFSVKGIDQNRREISVPDVKWTATGGTIDSNGNYVAGNDEGEFEITACIGEIRNLAKINVARQQKSEIKDPEKSDSSGKISWKGEVPAQKWMNFYTKVLSKFAGGKGLKLTLSVEVAEEGGISTQKVEETKAALRELGLDDNISNE